MAKNSKKAPSRSTTLIIISLVYIFMGIGSVLASFDLIKGLFHGAVPGAVELLGVMCGVMMFLAGIFGLFKIQRAARAWMGVLIFIVSLVSLVFSIIRVDFHGIGTGLMQASVAWLFIAYNQ